MSTFEPKYGDNVYSRSGHKGVYLVRTPGGWHAVAQLVVVDVDQGEPCDYGYETTEWQHVYAEAPAKVLDDEIAKRQAKLDEVSTALSEANRKKYEAERETSTLQKNHDTLVARLSQRCRVLQRIEDWLDGKFTHVVIESGYERPRMFSIATKEIATKSTDRYETRTRLITLGGSSNGDLEWELGYYSDHSGSKQRIHLAQSEEEAKRILCDLCLAKCEEVRATDGTSGLSELKNSLEAVGEKLPEDLEARLQKKVADQAVEAVRKAELALQEAKWKAQRGKVGAL